MVNKRRRMSGSITSTRGNEFFLRKAPDLCYLKPSPLSDSDDSTNFPLLASARLMSTDDAFRKSSFIEKTKMQKPNEEESS